ncbi:amidohydrolase [Candidatus Poribacteria bacterium]
MTRHIVLAIFVVYTAIFPFAGDSMAQDAKDQIAASIEARESTYADMAKQIWGFAELGYQEEKSSRLLESHLEDEGFTIESGVAEMPTAFVATYGQGKPIIAIFSEYDALPCLSQDAVPERKPIVEGGSGHGCGHHLFGTGSAAAAVAVKDWLAKSKTTGTIRLYGAPAEEGGWAKGYMVLAGLFDDVDVALHWHPGDRNDASPFTWQAVRGAKFRFHGVSAHAAVSPERGRSALDGVEAMNHMVNMLREHVPSEARMHYVITSGGSAPNVVPDFAEVDYFVRHPGLMILAGIWDRILKAAEGAALGTGTRMEYEVTGGAYNMLINETLHKLMDSNLRRVGGVKYTSEEMAFAESIRKTLGETELVLGSQEEIQPYQQKAIPGFTDAADVSWIVPTAEIITATYVPGTAPHTWQAVAAGGTSIGVKGMVVAAKTIAMTAVDLFVESSYIDQAHKEFRERRGADFQFRSFLGDSKPPLDFRK